MKILIIGGSGILSSSVVDCCISNGHEVTIMNRGNNLEFTNDKARLIVCDARKPESVKKRLNELHFDAVIDFIVYQKEQLELSLSLFGKTADQYVFISSAQVYNTSISKKLEETDDTPQPLWSYSINKNICEHYLIDYCLKNRINYTIVRPGVNYDNRRIPYGMYPPIGMHWTIVERIKAGKPIITWNKGENRLNLTRVEDFAKGLVGLLGNQKAYNETFNVVGDYVYRWKDVLDTLGMILCIQVKTIDLEVDDYASELQGDDKEMLLGGRACDLCCSNEKLKAVVSGFESKFDLESGMRKTIKWYKENGYYKGIDYAWDAEQDRIIHKFTKGYNGRFIGYEKKRWVELFMDRCNWNVVYYRDFKVLKTFWKTARKFIAKPIYRQLNK